MGRFNLLDEPWIAVMPADGGRAETVSLLTLFREAHRYQRLAGEMVTQDFAVLRLLLAVLTTVFTRFDVDGESYPFVELDERDRQTNDVDEDDLEEDEYEETMAATWETLWRRGRFPEIVTAYLEKWRDRFDLFDETYPFYQVREEDFERYGLKKKKDDKEPPDKWKGTEKYGTLFTGSNMNRLISESRNKKALFSPKNDLEKDVMDSAELARWLMMLQGYVGTGDKGKFRKKGSEETWSKGWLYDIGGICMAGDNLFETLMMNLVLCHPEEKDVWHRQRPCWEFEIGAFLDKLLRGEQPDNLAELYTNWARAIRIDLKTQASADIWLDMVKVPEIIHEEQVLELMTLWKTPPKKGDQTCSPRKHTPEQAMWRSFGLITLNKASDKQRRPGILDQYDAIRDLVGNRIVHLWAVSMRDDGDPRSRAPVDEIVDVLNLNEMVVTDQSEDGWCVRINEAVAITKKVVEQVYRTYIQEVAAVRKIGREDSKGRLDAIRKAYIESKKEDMYAEIDRPFRDWLEAIRPEDDKDAQIKIWKESLKRLVSWQARQILESGSHLDYAGHTIEIKGKKGKDKESRVINIATAYNRFCAKLNQLIPYS
ncbi:type I-E CRISPR-associated protein Cse1/CasA [Pseudoramibacter faecis]|uniref:type I-E CRISPR-associated protein Cse1/CasA n=1 Tax=Pseudoramibacter faecis TaxID=3108534 RepID=UPI002E7A6DE1|nr:type I-E CRISPR-associated protein Cse1/CasA [Pseudoramibacter sp. HA2172]